MHKNIYLEDVITEPLGTDNEEQVPSYLDQSKKRKSHKDKKIIKTSNKVYSNPLNIKLLS